jgi:phage shock protein PspC (stress-responsive transcriptional regulator)
MERQMADEAPRDERDSDRGDDSEQGTARPESRAEDLTGPPEGFEPPAAPGEVPGAKPWPTLGQEPSGGAGPAGVPEHQAGYQYGYHENQGGGVPPNAPRRLYRSEHDRVIAGVCGGLRDYLGIDANLLRVIFVLLAVFAGGSGLLIYVLLWALVPRESRVGISPSESAMDAVNEVRDRFQSLRRA